MTRVKLLRFEQPGPDPGMQEDFRYNQMAEPHRILRLWLKLLLPGLLPLTVFPAPPDANTIIQRSVDTLKLDWAGANAYDYIERDLGRHGSRTWQVMMILGSPYRRLDAVNNKPLSPENRQKEKQKLENATAERCGESKPQTDKRIQQYEKDRERDHKLMEELTKAFEFKLLDEQLVDGHMTWLLQATPLPGYRPADNQTKVLTGMQGRLWIDQSTFQWVKIEASVIHPVSIEGFLAKVEPGTKFELEKAPVPGGIWLPKHFSVKSKAEVLSFIGHNTHDDETYSDYQKTDFVDTSACPATRPEP